MILYQDAFEVVNPLGSAKSKHKLVGVYYTLGNLPSYMRSNINHIQLVLLCKDSYIKKFGVSTVFKKLVDDLKVLETVGVEGRNGEFIKGTLHSIVGDNLGSHTIGGFQESFASTHFCRYCSISNIDFKNDPLLVGDLRDYESYNLHAGSSKNFGVKYNSVFNELAHFHVAKPGLPPCLGHDLFEGIVAYDLMLCITHFISNDWFDIDEINRLVKCFKFKEYDAADKPCPLKKRKEKETKNAKLSGTAKQTWNFLRFLPLILYTKLKNHNDPVWDMLLNLRSIVEYVCAHKTHMSQVSYLQYLINQYIEKRVDLFPNDSLKPKHHYLRHYPWLILQFGPLIRMWTLRFESKHSFFKRTARILGNYINLEQTLSKKHQMLQAFLSEGSLFKPDLIVEQYLPVDRTFYSPEIMQSINKCCFAENSTSYTCAASYKGTLYKKDMFVLIERSSEDDSIIAGKIVLCLIENNSKLHFVVEKVRLQLDLNLGVHYVNYASSSHDCVAHDCLLDFYPLIEYVINSISFVTLKHQPLLIL